MEAAAVARISEFNPQDFSNLIWAFAKLNHTPGPTFQVEFEEAALDNMRSFNTQNLSNTAYAYAALDLPGARNILPFVSVHLADRLSECRPQELVMVLWAYARCNFDPGPDAMAGIEAAAMDLAWPIVYSHHVRLSPLTLSSVLSFTTSVRNTYFNLIRVLKLSKYMVCE